MKVKIIAIIGGVMAAIGTLLPIITVGIPGTLTLAPKLTDVGGVAYLLILLAVGSVGIGIVRLYREFGYASVWAAIINGVGAFGAVFVAVTSIQNAHELVEGFSGFGRMFAGNEVNQAATKITSGINISLAAGTYCMIAGFILAMAAALASGKKTHQKAETQSCQSI